MKKFFLLFLASLIISCIVAQADTVRVLTIGNSFTGNALAGFEPIAKDAGDTLICGKAIIGGSALEKHAGLMKEYDADPTKGKPYGKPTQSLQELLQKEKWDFVTIQHHSRGFSGPSTFQPHANDLIACVRKYAPDAKVLLYQTWAFREDHAMLQKDKTPDLMYAEIVEAYDGFAKELGVKLIPAGHAFQAARMSPEWGKPILDKDFDYKNPTYPNLPKESRSLHRSPYWAKDKDNPEKNNFAIDSFHAGPAGEYLLGCVWYEMFFGKSCIGNPNRKGVTDEEATILQKIAHETVEKNK